jgi:L-seryl-tRNA(Ser) seleniumtransferase
MGRGSRPIDLLPSHALRIVPHGKRAAGRALTELAGALRSRPVPVIGRIANGALLLDLRCLCGDAEEAIFRALFDEPDDAPAGAPRDRRSTSAIQASAPGPGPT